MKKFIRLISTIFICSFASTSYAGLILQDDTNNIFMVDSFEPGQSFVAEDSTISFGYYFDCINCYHVNSDSLRLSLLEGDGLGGTVLTSVDFFLADSFSGFYDVDLSAVTLNVGSSYTAALEVLGNSAYWGIRVHIYNGDAYTNGELHHGLSFGGENQDARFRVNPLNSAAPTSVPEPASLILLGLGLAGLGFSRKLKQA